MIEKMMAKVDRFRNLYQKVANVDTFVSNFGTLPASATGSPVTASPRL